MNQNLRKITQFLQQNDSLSVEEKASLSKVVMDVDKELTITTFKLDRTEKVKRTTAILLEETIEELERKRKAVEAQNRDLEIEASLERVRSSTMMMYNSSDVGNATAVLFAELENLGIKTIRCGIIIGKKEEEKIELWTASGAGKGQVMQIVGEVDVNIHPLLKGSFEAWLQEKDFFSFKLQGNDKDLYYRSLATSLNYPISNTMGSLPDHYCTSFMFREGGLFVFTFEPFSSENSTIFKKFANVFSQTYRRYVDLKQAEAQAKEARKASSLDRVRGQIASMRTADDLQRITPVIWHELNSLDVPFIRCGVFIVEEEKSNVHVYLTTPDVKPLGALSLPIESTSLTKIIVHHWEKGIVYREHWNRDQFINWTQSMLELGQIQDRITYQGSELPPESLDLHFVPFVQGMLYVGNVSPLSDEKIELVKALAEAFSIAYARYEDFYKLEKAKESIEATLTELKATQSQLIQSEKMASLGELTAGIAHEIQNPLNFVNNFSEVSTELLDEMKDEIAAGNWQLATEIADDVKQNLERINHHGKRADAIVKGMLQHSQASSGQKEPTDINALADEYLRLAYHGLRAKDKSFNATLKTEFDENIGKISVVPQDIGRVILNLITNAFHAVTAPPGVGIEKRGTDYKPTVTVKTASWVPPSGGKGVLISVSDNGPGIPTHIVDKIFQPFFTTKPTGQGTGLGLSLSYDIVKAHGGELKVKTKEGEGAEFIIQIPIQT